jgi:hypothetical protein
VSNRRMSESCTDPRQARLKAANEQWVLQKAVAELKVLSSSET